MSIGASYRDMIWRPVKIFGHSELPNVLPRTVMTNDCDMSPCLAYSEAKSHVAVTFLQPSRKRRGYGLIKRSVAVQKETIHLACVAKSMTLEYKHIIALPLL